MTCGAHEIPSRSLLRWARHDRMPHGEEQRHKAICSLQHPFDDTGLAGMLVVAHQSSDVYTEISSPGQMEI